MSTVVVDVHLCHENCSFLTSHFIGPMYYVMYYLTPQSLIHTFSIAPSRGESLTKQTG